MFVGAISPESSELVTLLYLTISLCFAYVSPLSQSLKHCKMILSLQGASVKILILSLLFSASVHSREVTCSDILFATMSACKKSAWECRNLGTCIYRRQVCPNGYKSQQSCMELNQCMSEKKQLKANKPRHVRRYEISRPCSYSWENNKCKLALSSIGWESEAPCPGRWFRETPEFNDKGLNCDSHRKVVQAGISECRTALEVYAFKCKSSSDFVDIQEGLSCDQISAVLFPADSAHKGQKSINDTGRSKHKSLYYGHEGSRRGNKRATSIGK